VEPRQNSARQPELVPGQKVGGGRYTLVRFLGKGGMGVVWLAQDGRLDEQVALKFLAGEIAYNPEALEDMRRETCKSRKLSHPNIIRIHDLHEGEGELPFISMEYIEGAALSSIKAQRPNRLFPWPEIQPLMKQLCEALDYAHAQKVIHRDLKPANMLVTRDGVLKLADFGIRVNLLGIVFVGAPAASKQPEPREKSGKRCSIKGPRTLGTWYSTTCPCLQPARRPA